MKKTLLSIAALTFVFGSSVAMAQTTPSATPASTSAGKHVKPAAKSTHHKHKAKAAAAK